MSDPLYLNAVDEAMRRKRSRGRPRGAVPPRRQVNDIAIRQLKDVERQRKTLSVRLAERHEPCPTCNEPAPLAPAEIAAIVKASSDVSDQIVKLSQSIRLGYEAERKAFEGLTEEQLESVYRAQLGRIATYLEDHEKRMMLTVWFGHEIAEVLLKPREAAT